MKKLSLLAFLMILLSLPALSGTGGGNGGGVHYCPFKRATYEFYDVYEGKHRYGFKIKPINLPQELIISNAINKIKGKNITLALEIEEQIKHLKEPGNFVLLPNAKLKLVPDANILWKQLTCKYKQLANWDDLSNKVFVNKYIYNRMDRFNQAALWLHEAVYKVARNRTDIEFSDPVRVLVAEMLSTSSEITAHAFMEKENDVLVRFDESSLVVNEYKNDERKVTINLGKTPLDMASLGAASMGRLTIDISFPLVSQEIAWLNERLEASRMTDKALLQSLFNLYDVMENTVVKVIVNNEVHILNYRNTSLTIDLKREDKIVLSGHAPIDQTGRSSSLLSEVAFTYELTDGQNQKDYQDNFKFFLPRNGQDSNFNYNFQLTQWPVPGF